MRRSSLLHTPRRGGSALAAFLSLVILAAAPLAGAAQEAGKVYRIPVTGVVEMGLAPFIERSLREAQEAGATAAVLDIDTPGGRIDAAEQIADALRDAPIPTYAYVNRRAFSAGAMIALATDGVFMRPGSVMGAATPVNGEGEKLSEKMVSAMRSEFRALAEERGLDPRVAEGMVDESIGVPGVTEPGQLVSLSTQEAAALGYAREVQDWDGVLAAVGAPRARTVTTEVNWAEQVVRFVTNPMVAPFLLSLGFLGLLIELKTPAFGMAGLAGATSLGLFFGSHLIVGLAGWEVLVLVAAGIILLLVEALVLPGFGVAGILGVLAMGGAVVLSLLGNFPSTGDVLVALNVVGASIIAVGVVGWLILKRLPDDRRAGRMILHGSTSREAGYLSAPVRSELVGIEGVALTDLRPSGTGAFGEERIDVVSEGAYVAAGTPIRIVRAEGYRHVVSPVAPA
ncbi:MAG TPA: NfeD family protein [Longimicrobiaceae bacterium]|nr:NfeD family protein [Longimicrobiaceae bacterium]